MSTTPATDSAESDPMKLARPSRLDRTSPLPARGRSYQPRSRRGLLHNLVVDPACPYCGEAHVYRSTGLRIAACRGGYLMIEAV